MFCLDENSDDAGHEKYGAGSVIKLFIPVTICKSFLTLSKCNCRSGMALVVFSIQTLEFYVPDANGEQDYIIYTPFHPTQEDT